MPGTISSASSCGSLFCLFADDTGIFEPRGIFLDLLETRTREDGSDVGPMDRAPLRGAQHAVEKPARTNLDEDLQRFPYVNGDLFRERLRITRFRRPRCARRLLDACDFRWDAISPAIFGALFQSVMNAHERRALGAHYTTEKNIMKVIEPLFLDDLRAEFARLRARTDTGRKTALEGVPRRARRSLRFLDPACGCGNFLVIAYRELRALELDCAEELNARRVKRTLLSCRFIRCRS